MNFFSASDWGRVRRTTELCKQLKTDRLFSFLIESNLIDSDRLIMFYQQLMDFLVNAIDYSDRFSLFLDFCSFCLKMLTQQSALYEFVVSFTVAVLAICKIY